MKVFTTLGEWRAFRENVRTRPIGFVPTMGALHEGHMSLVETCREQNELTVVSIFVNPQQFDDKKDLAAYPSDDERDLEQLERSGVDVVLKPEAAQIYADNYRFKVTENEFSRRLCGAHRPGHFDGVLTVVMRLLNLVRADNAYFGEKDYQQLQLIRDMASAFFMPVNIVACPTVREADGLAMSSRNRRLDGHARRRAALLYAALKNSGSAEDARQMLINNGFNVDYVEDVANRRLAAARLAGTRLIDNVEI